MTPLGFGKIRRRSALLLLLIALLFIGVVVIAARAVLKARVSAHETDLIVTVVSFPRDAKVTRAGQVLANVLPGTRLRRNDVLFGGTKGNFDLYIGSLAIVRVKPGTNVLLQTLLQRSNGDLDVGVKINTGRVLTRLRRLTGQSQFHMNAPGAVTAARGTAYMVQGTKSRTSVLVAEGRVGVQLPAGGRELLLSPRRKVTFTTALPAASVPTTPADEPVIRELLGLGLPPVAGAGVGTTPTALSNRDWSGADVGDIVVTNVINFNAGPGRGRDYFGLAPYTVTYSPLWRIPGRRAIILRRSTGFLTVDGGGVRRSVGLGLRFESTSPDGDTIYASRPGAGLYAMNFDGTNLRRITRRPVASCFPSPDGRHLLVSFMGLTYYPSERRYLRSSYGPGTSLGVMRVDGTGFRTIARNAEWNVQNRRLRDGTNYRYSANQAMNAFWTKDGNILLHKGIAILRLSAEGNLLQRIARDASPERAKFSPSKKWVVFEGGWVQIKPGDLVNRKRALFAVNTSTGKRTTLPSPLTFDTLDWVADNIAYRTVINEQVNIGQTRTGRSGVTVPAPAIIRGRREYILYSPENAQQSRGLFPKERPWALWEVSPDNQVIAYVAEKSRRLGFADAENPRIYSLTGVRFPTGYNPSLKWISGGREISFSASNKKVILSLDSRPAIVPVKLFRSLWRTASPLLDYARTGWIAFFISLVILAIVLLSMTFLGIGIARLFRALGETLHAYIQRSRQRPE